jgi:hypothetical protein
VTLEGSLLKLCLAMANKEDEVNAQSWPPVLPAAKGLPHFKLSHVNFLTVNCPASSLVCHE